MGRCAKGDGVMPRSLTWVMALAHWAAELAIHFNTARTRMADSHVIDVRVSDIRQLFNSLDPSPFHEKDLDRDAEDYIVGWADEVSPHAALELVVRLPAEQMEWPQRATCSALCSTISPIAPRRAGDASAFSCAKDHGLWRSAWLSWPRAWFCASSPAR